MFVPLMQLDLVQGNGFSSQRVLGTDIRVLEDVGLIRVSNYHSNDSGFNFYLPPEALAYYEHLKKRSGEPVAAIEEDVRRYLDADAFRAAHPAAHARWTDAANELWSAGEPDLTTIGHQTREAMQHFATELVEKHQPPDVDTDPAHTAARLTAVIQMHRERLGEARSHLLNALIGYWGEVSDLVQRQEHGGQKEGEPLTWEDGRRAVFQTAIVMYEIDRTL